MIAAWQQRHYSSDDLLSRQRGVFRNEHYRHFASPPEVGLRKAKLISAADMEQFKLTLNHASLKTTE
jgi:hypothetical protein